MYFSKCKHNKETECDDSCERKKLKEENANGVNEKKEDGMKEWLISFKQRRWKERRWNENISGFIQRTNRFVEWLVEREDNWKFY